MYYCCHPYVIYEDTECGDIKKCASHSRAHTGPTVCILITVVACFVSVLLPHKQHISRNKPYSQHLSILIYISSLHVTFCVYLYLPRCVSLDAETNLKSQWPTANVFLDHVTCHITRAFVHVSSHSVGYGFLLWERSSYVEITTQSAMPVKNWFLAVARSWPLRIR